MQRLMQVLGSSLVAAVVLTGCYPTATLPESPDLLTHTTSPTPENTAQRSPAATRTPTPTSTSLPTAAFVSVIDGDTVETSAGTVRIIGIDTPERGECGHEQASLAIAQLVGTGDRVTLDLPRGQNDVDRYGRLIRYVITASGVDLGLMQLEAGNAVARYDSTDGYPAHPQEAAYHAAQLASLSRDRSVIAVGCEAAAPPVVAPPAEGSWWTQYSSCTKLKRNTVGHPTGPFRHDDSAQAEIYNWFAYGTGNNGDGDNDGLACE